MGSSEIYTRAAAGSRAALPAALRAGFLTQQKLRLIASTVYVFLLATIDLLFSF